MGKDFTVTINNAERKLEWLEMVGTTKLYIKSFKPELVTLAGTDEAQPVFYLDLDLLHLQQYQRLIHYLARKFNLPLRQMRRNLEEQGVPIPAADCALTIYNPHRWL